MNRIPKYTAGMFKKKMPRFGAMGIRKQRLPLPPKPRVKKFAEGGSSKAEIIISEEEGRKAYPELYERMERKKKAYELQQSKDFVNRYLSERKKADEAAAKKKAEESDKKREFDAYMEERKKREQAEDWRSIQEMKKGIRTARKGGTMKSSCCRGDGIAKRGKTRGKFI